jgi:hypothetical protein
MAKITYRLEGEDAALIEATARELCLQSGGNCYMARYCGSRSKCAIEGWSTYVDNVEIMLSVLRETHLITPR